MASLREYRDKSGKLISFYIKVHRGKDIKPYSTTFKVDPKWGYKKAKKEAEKYALIYEEECKKGKVMIEDVTLREYMEYMIELKYSRGQLKERTYALYKGISEKINRSIMKYIRHINPHAFRHTMTSMLYNEGVDPVSISARLGHARVSITSDLYAHKINRYDEKNAKTLENIFIVEK